MFTKVRILISPPSESQIILKQLIDSVGSLGLGSSLEAWLHGVGSSGESSEGKFLASVILPGEVLDNLGCTVDFVANLMDRVGWFALGSSFSLGDSIHTLMLKSEGKDSLDSVFVSLLLDSSNTEGVSRLSCIVESAQREWGLGPLVSVELNKVAVELLGKSPDHVLRWGKIVWSGLSWSCLFGSRLLWCLLSRSRSNFAWLGSSWRLHGLWFGWHIPTESSNK